MPVIHVSHFASDRGWTQRTLALHEVDDLNRSLGDVCHILAVRELT